MLKAIEAGEGAKAKRLAHNHVQRAIDRVVDRINARANHEGSSQ
jgi:DNA-binding GntR family transcriptional regulator